MCLRPFTNSFFRTLIFVSFFYFVEFQLLKLLHRTCYGYFKYTLDHIKFKRNRKQSEWGLKTFKVFFTKLFGRDFAFVQVVQPSIISSKFGTYYIDFRFFLNEWVIMTSLTYTVEAIYTPIFSFFRKQLLYIAIKAWPVPNERTFNLHTVLFFRRC